MTTNSYFYTGIIAITQGPFIPHVRYAVKCNAGYSSVETAVLCGYVNKIYIS